MAKQTTINLTEGNLTKQILLFSWPILLSSIFQNLYSITNSVIVGNYISKTALSAVSATNSICNIYNFLFYGLGTGAGIVIATYYGAKDEKNLKLSIDTSIVFAIVGGFLLTVVSELLTPLMLDITNVNAELRPMAQSYLRIYFLGNVAVLVYQISFFILRSLGNSRYPLYFVILSSIINLVLGVFFVRVWDLSVMGTALATIISQFVVDFLCLRLLIHLDQSIRFDLRHIEFHWGTAKRICSLGIPAGVQNMMIAFSAMMIQSYVNLFPNEIIAGIGVAEKVASLAQIPMSSISTATVNMVSQNMGAQHYDRAQQVVKISIRLSNIITLFCSILVFCFAKGLVSLFNHDPLVIQSGSEMIRMTVFSYIPLGWSHIYHGAIRGSGNVKVPMFNAVMSQCVARYLFVYIGLKIVYDVHILYFSAAFGFICAGVVAALYFNHSRWTQDVHLRP